MLRIVIATISNDVLAVIHQCIGLIPRRTEHHALIIVQPSWVHQVLPEKSIFAVNDDLHAQCVLLLYIVLEGLSVYICETGLQTSMLHREHTLDIQE